MNRPARLLVTDFTVGHAQRLHRCFWIHLQIPLTGQIMVKTKRVAALFELGSSFEPDFTGRENVLLHGAMLDIPEEEKSSMP
jgi:hypothetical protein